jgi:hypothetical protein
MTGPELAAFLLLAPFLVVAAAYVGRKAQRLLWELDLPYEQRRALKKRK